MDNTTIEQVISWESLVCINCNMYQLEMIVWEESEDSNSLDWMNYKLLQLERDHSRMPNIVILSLLLQKQMECIESSIVLNSNPFKLEIIHSLIIIHLNWIISLLFDPLVLVMIVSIGFLLFLSLVSFDSLISIHRSSFSSINSIRWCFILCLSSRCIW